MKRRLVLVAVLAMVAGSFGVAQAHRCDDVDDPETCEETPVMPNWRDGNYIPLFDLEDREDEDQRRDAQRWREECNTDDPQSPNYQSRQMCFWAYGGFSVFPNRGSDPTDPNSYSPNEWHVGFAANHCFLFEAAHQCEDHNHGEGTHDAHGGAMYADICLTENPESKYCKEGLKGSQVGVTIMDHNACGTIVPVVACTDEYHVIRPFDPDFTMGQMEDSVDYIGRIMDDPELYLCGYEEYRASNPVCPGGSGGGGDGDNDDPYGYRSVGDEAHVAPGTSLRGHRVAARLGSADVLALAGVDAGARAPAGSDGATAATAWLVGMVGLAALARRARRLVLH